METNQIIAKKNKNLEINQIIRNKHMLEFRMRHAVHQNQH